VDGESVVRELLLVLKLSSLVNVGEFLKLLLDPPELNPSLLGPLDEDVSGVREGVHQIQQVLLLQTVRVRRVFHRGLVRLTGTKRHEDLIVTEVVGWIEGEELILVLVRQRDGD